MIDIRFQYKKIFSVKIKHNFYPDSIPTELHMVPTKRTVELIDKMSMLLRNKDGETHILFDASNKELLTNRLRNSSKAESKLSFLIYCDNQYFVNITDIPFNLKDKVFYLSNKKLGTNKRGNLHDNDFVEDSDLLSAIPMNKGNHQSNSFELKLDNGESHDKIPVMKFDSFDQLDLSKLMEGHYGIFGNDTELLNFINLESKTRRSPIGYIDIFLTKDIKQQIIDQLEGDNLTEFNYEISFNARSVYWKYIIVPTYIKRFRSIEIKSAKDKDKISFNSLGEEEIEKKKVFSFISEKVIKFQKHYNYENQLKKKESESGAKTIVKKMPYASFDILKPVYENSYMSEIYVYI